MQTFSTLRTLLAVTVTCLVVSGCGKKNQIEYEDQFERAIGELLGQKVAAAAPGGGKVVVLLRQGSGELEDQRNQAYLDGLKIGLDSDTFEIQQAGPDLTTIKPEQQSMVMWAVTKGWPPRAYLGWCAVDRSAVAVVSFIEFPNGIRAGHLSKLPPLYIFSATGGKTLRALASQGAVKIAILPGTGTEKDATPPKKATAEEIVRLGYEVISS